MKAGETQAVAPRAMYGSDCRSMLPPERLHPSWRRCARVGSGLVLGFAAVLLCLSGSEQPGSSGSSELDSVVSLPVMGTGGGPSLPYHDGNGFVVSLPVFGTGGGPTTRPIDDGSDSSKPVMGTACKDCPELDGPTVQRPGGWQNYSSEFNVFGLKAYTGGIYNAQPSFTGGDADTPGALPNAGRNEWNNNFADYDFKPADKHDSAGEQAEAIMNGLTKYGEVKFSGHPSSRRAPTLYSPSPSAGWSTLAGGGGTTGQNSAASQAAAIIGGATGGGAGGASDTGGAGAGAGDGDGAGNNGLTSAASQAASIIDAATAGKSNGGAGAGAGDAAKPPVAAEGGNQGGSVNGDNNGGKAGGGGIRASGGTQTAPALGNNCYLLPSLCPQYSFPYPGFKGAGGGVTHVDGEPKADAASGGSAQNVKPDGSVQKVNPDGTVHTGGNNELGGPSSDVVLGAFQGAPTKPDAPPPTPAPYAATLVFDTSADNGAAGTGEAIKVDSSVDASFVGGAPVVPAAAKMSSRPIELALVRVGDGIVQGASNLRNLAQMKTRPFAGTKMPIVLPGGHHRGFWQTKLSQEEDTGDHSNDDNLQEIDDQLGRLSSMYDKKVGTINFGSRGMTDTRNDFLEGTSGSIFNTMQTSAPGSKKSHVSKLLALVPTGLRVIPDAKVAALEDIGANNYKKSYDTELVAL